MKKQLFDTYTIVSDNNEFTCNRLKETQNKKNKKKKYPNLMNNLGRSISSIWNRDKAQRLAQLTRIQIFLILFSEKEINHSFIH